jgi:hypothetical protein
MASDLRPTEKEDLIQVSSDTNLKSKFQGVFVDLFWVTPKNECPEFVNKYVDILLLFATSYLRVAAFLTKKNIKSICLYSVLLILRCGSISLPFDLELKITFIIPDPYLSLIK